MLGVAGGFVAFQIVSPATGLNGATAVATPVALEIGQPAPPLRGSTLDGTSFDLASLRGRPVVVNFWASWCIPCRSEFPELKAALQRYAGQRLAMVGVVFDDTAASARAFAQGEGASWPSLADPSGAIARSYKVVAVPQTYFIDRSGIVRERQIGPVVSEADLAGLLAPVLR